MGVVGGGNGGRNKDVSDGGEGDGEEGDEAEVPAPRGHLAGGIDEAEECGEDETCEGVSSAGIGSRGDVFG